MYEVRRILEDDSEEIEGHLKKWFAIKLLENDDRARDRIHVSDRLADQIKASSLHLKIILLSRLADRSRNKISNSIR